MKTLQLWIGVALSAALSCGSIRDERAQIHVLKVGDFMGENSGVITSIDEGAINIDQLVRSDEGNCGN